MLGILLAFRKLALSSELDTLRAVGLGYGRLLRVPYLYAIALMALNLAIVGFVQPYAQYAYQELRFELRSGALGASIKVGEFTNLGRRMTLAGRAQREQGHRSLRRLRPRRQPRRARRSRSPPTAAPSSPPTIPTRSSSGSPTAGWSTTRRAYRTPRVLSFDAHDLPIDLPAIEAFRGRGDGTKELTMPELVRIGGDRRARPRRGATRPAPISISGMVEVVMMLLLPLLAVALAVPPKRSTSGLGIFLVDRDGRHLSQGEPICRADGRARPDRSADRAVGAVPAVRRR